MPDGETEHLDNFIGTPGPCMGRISLNTCSWKREPIQMRLIKLYTRLIIGTGYTIANHTSLFSLKDQPPEHGTLDDFSYEKWQSFDFHSARLDQGLRGKLFQYFIGTAHTRQLYSYLFRFLLLIPLRLHDRKIQNFAFLVGLEVKSGIFLGFRFENL